MTEQEKNDLIQVLFGILEDLVIENQALNLALQIALQSVSAGAAEKIAAAFDQAKADPTLGEAVERKLAQYKRQSLADTLRQLQQETDWKIPGGS